MEEMTASYELLMASGGVGALEIDPALGRIAALVNLSDDLKKVEGAIRALEWSDTLEARGVSAAVLAVLDYFRSNAWAARAAIRNANAALTWTWEQPEIAQQVLLLRKALNNPAFDDLPDLYRCQIPTNLGNQLNAVGRFVEALEYWDRALAVDTHFWMAQGNRGYAYIHYAKALYDHGHRAPFLLTAHKDLNNASSYSAAYKHFGYPEAAQQFAALKADLESRIDVVEAEKIIQLDGDTLGETKEEERYRRWCLANRLFLNPLNDLGSHSIAARDVLTLPDFVTAIDEPPSLTGFFNQMKQEFVSARWLYYESRNYAGVHFSDRDVLLYNTLDYPSYGLGVEKLKIAMRMAYSLFDKIAYFLNDYMKLNMKSTRVNFSTVWRSGEGKAAPVRPEFEKSENWPFRGLYWLSKDLLVDDFRDSTEPDARELYQIRNHLEHKYLKVHETRVRPKDPSSPSSWLVDDLAYSVSRSELSAKALRVLKLARAALTYLSLGMHREEKRRAHGKTGVAVPMTLGVWEDEWKQ